MSDAEFAQAKRKLLASQEERPPSEPDRTLGEAANRYVSFQMVMTVIGTVIGIIIFLFIVFGVFLPAMQGSRGPTIHLQPPR